MERSRHGDVGLVGGGASEGAAVAAIRAGDDRIFASLVERYRRELQVSMKEDGLSMGLVDRS
jgi:hypothetical protein